MRNNRQDWKKGGVLTIVRAEVELKVTASDIPEKLIADLDGLEIGDGITISNIELPEGSRAMITDRDFVIANISAPSALKSTDDEDESGQDDGGIEETEEDNKESSDENSEE